MTPRSCLSWKPMGKIFKTVGLRWVPTRRVLTSSTTKVDSEPLNGSNADITNQYECEQTLDVSADKYLINQGFKEFSSDVQEMTSDHNSLELRLHDYNNEQSSSKLVPKVVLPTSVANNTSGLVPQRQKASDYDNPDPVPQRQDVYSSVDADSDVPSQQELDLLFGPLYNKFFNAGSNPSTNKQSTSAPSAHTNVHAEENNNDQAEEGEHLQDDAFTNPLCTPVQEEAESSTQNIDPKMCMYTLTVSTAEPKNIKEVMADSAWIEAMQEELHQFDRLQAKYTLEILHKHGMDKGQSIGTPMATKPKLDADLSGNPVDQTDYRSKIMSLMYLTSSRPDIVQAYPKGYSFELTAFSDADHAGCIDSRKSTYGEIQFLCDKLVSWMSKKQSCTAITEYQLADMFSKALPEDRFKYLVRRIGMRFLTPAELEVLAKEYA
uniref:Reverse transcriptase Ty1/copia-type domain-containing protein n=1 Tax=Tanacetum cinerariifolium TaxID=118510 RepID=A0A6L2L113_TANCI|nr:hypothetical protein [Tanacetum cinerariifolium]